jgi:ABC-2 type transport system permease protein
MFDETAALTFRALRKWVRNPASVMPGLATSVFYLVLFGSSFNPANLIPSGAQQYASSILKDVFGGAPTYITYLTSGVICIILVFNMAFGGIDLVLDRQLGYLNTLLTAPVPRAAIYLSGVAQNLAKVLLLAVLTFVVALIVPNGLELPASFGVLNFLGAFAAFILLGLGLSFVFTALALSVRSIDSLVAIVNFLTLPIMFMSNAFFPPSSFPAWLRGIADVNPVTKANEAARLLFINGSLTSAQLATYWWDMAYLVGFAAVLGALGYLAAKRALRPE